MKVLLSVLLIMASMSIFAKSPPKNIIGIGNDSCESFVDVYESKQKINTGEEKDINKIVGVFGAYGDFVGTFGGFLAANMMYKNDTNIPFENSDHAMSLIYEICKKNPDYRFIDIVWTISESAFGRKIE